MAGSKPAKPTTKTLRVKVTPETYARLSRMAKLSKRSIEYTAEYLLAGHAKSHVQMLEDFIKAVKIQLDKDFENRIVPFLSRLVSVNGKRNRLTKLVLLCSTKTYAYDFFQTLKIGP